MKTTEIIMCEKCTGSGVVQCRELEDYHKGEYREWNEICKECLGSGRLEKTTTVELTAFIPEEYRVARDNPTN